MRKMFLGAAMTTIATALLLLSGFGCKKEATNSDSPGSGSTASSSASSTGYEDRGATLLQRSTRLEWQKQPADHDMTWGAAKDYCATLSLGGNRWRLPTKDELLLFYNFKQGADFSREAFLATKQVLLAFYKDASSGGDALYRGLFWSSSSDVDSLAWGMGFGGGNVSVEMRNTTSANHVRCVR